MDNASAEALRGEPVRTPLQRHIADLKRRLYWCGFTFIVACVLAFPHADEMIASLKKPYHDDLIFYAPTEAIFAAIKVALLGGITLSMPVFLYHLWKFIEPALLPGERRWIVPFLAITSVFFAMGVSFANFVIVPLALQFMLQFGIDRALVPQLGVGFYVDFNVKFLLTFGFAFELPLVLTLLSRLGIVTPDLLARYRKHAIMVNLILSAILTPTSDLFNLLLMAGPLIILYEIGILSARLWGRPPARPAEEEMEEPVKVPEGTAGRRILFLVVLVAGLSYGDAFAQLSPGGMLDVLGPEGFVSIQSLALGEGQTVYAGSFGRGVFKSEDGGKTWTGVNEGMTDPYVYVVVVAPDRAVFAGTLRGGIFRSKNGGKSWAPVNTGLDRLETQVLLAHQGVLYAGTGAGVYRSKNGRRRTPCRRTVRPGGRAAPGSPGDPGRYSPAPRTCPRSCSGRSHRAACPRRRPCRARPRPRRHRGCHSLVDARPRLAPIFTLEDAPAETSRVNHLPLAQRQRLDADEALRAEHVQHAAWAELSERV